MIANQRSAQIVHVLFLDVVGYSRESTSAQARLLDRLNRLVTTAPAYAAALAAQAVQPIPTGDGMALLFLKDVIAPAQCAVDVSRALRQTAPDTGAVPDTLKVRMGCTAAWSSRSWTSPDGRMWLARESTPPNAL